MNANVKIYSRVKTISLEETTVICLVYFQVQKFKSALDPVSQSPRFTENEIVH